VKAEMKYKILELKALASF